MFRINGDNSMEIIRGDTGSFELTVKEKDEEGAEVPYVLAEGDIVIFTVKKTTKDAAIVIQKVGTAASESTVLFTIDPEDTEELKYGRYYYDIEFDRYDGYVDTIVPPATFTVREEVTF